VNTVNTVNIVNIVNMDIGIVVENIGLMEYLVVTEWNIGEVDIVMFHIGLTDMHTG